jgi:hypothetical protein
MVAAHHPKGDSGQLPHPSPSGTRPRPRYPNPPRAHLLPSRAPSPHPRCEDRIRNAKDTGLRNLPLHGFAQNQIWCELVSLASDLIAWMQMLALSDQPARRWEPKRLRLRIFSAAARLVKGGRRLRLRLAAHWKWADLITVAIKHLQTLPAP